MKRLLVSLSILLTTFFSVTAFTGMASAGGAARFYNNYGSSVNTYPCINLTTPNIWQLLCGGGSSWPDTYRFTILCWRDAAIGYPGNYVSRRWFRGEVWNSNGWYRLNASAWVHSSYVFNQNPSNRCA